MFDVFTSLVDCGRWSLTMYKSWFDMKLIINSYVMGKGGKRLGILILSNTKCRFHVYYILGGGSRGGNFEPRVDKSRLYPILKCFSPPTPYLIPAT